MAFERGDVVRVPFPYTNRPVLEHRPALVVGKSGSGDMLLWVLMITAAENRSWPGDVGLGDVYANAGLPAPSVIRTAKIATIEAANADRLGYVGIDILAAVMAEIRQTLSL